MRITKDKYIANATKYVGTVGGDNNHKKLRDLYNGCEPLPRRYAVKSDDAWCAMFVSAIAVESGCADIFPRECSCFYMAKIARTRGYEIEKEKLNVGDFIIYDWKNDGTYDHVGVVVQRQNKNLVVLEGNKGNKCGYRNVGVGSTNIKFAFRIPWVDVSVSNGHTVNYSIDAVARRVLNGEFGNGIARKRALERNGYDWKLVQERVNFLLTYGDKTTGDLSLDEVARKVIRGDYGVGKARYDNLSKAGYDAKKVQQRVNEMLKTGKVK